MKAFKAAQATTGRSVVLFLCLVLMPVACGAPASAGAAESEATAPAGMVWIPSTDSRVEWDGFPSPPTTTVMRSGSRLRLRTDSPSLAVRFSILSPVGDHINMHLYGAAGLVFYIDDQYLTAFIPSDPKGTPPLKNEVTVFSSEPRRMRAITIYAPIMAECSIEALGVSADAKFEKPKPFRLAKPVVFYGTSITNGCCAAHAGVTYEAFLGRRLNVDYIIVPNIALPGDLRMASVLAGIDASAYVIDYIVNVTSIKFLRQTFRPMIEILRSKRPDTPIICITPIYWAGVEHPSVPAAQPKDEQEERNREVVRDAVHACMAQGDRKIFLVEGYDLLGPDQGDGITDGGHPNTLGFYWLSRGLEPTLREVLGPEP